MKRKTLPFERAPLFLGTFREPTVAAFERQARACWYAGADGIYAELKNLRREDRTVGCLRVLMEATALPTICCLYRADIYGGDDDERTETLLAALDAGAACIDLQADLFDPQPREWTRKRSAVARQKRLVGRIHDAGAQVLFSSHLPSAATHGEILDQMLDIERRGADILKIVQKADTEEEFLEAARTTMLLRRRLDKPFVHLVSGAFGDLHRFIAPTLGVSLALASIDKRDEFPGPQPPLYNMKAVYSNLRFAFPDA